MGLSPFSLPTNISIKRKKKKKEWGATSHVQISCTALLVGRHSTFGSTEGAGEMLVTVTFTTLLVAVR
jgi:CxxC motif-containing protein (DUF1111 family)